MERIGDEVRRTLSRGGRDHVLTLREITAVWPSVVGPAVARQAWPLRMARDGTLHVATSSSTWAFELDRLSGEVLERLSSRLTGEAPTRLRFRPGPVPEPGPPPAEPSGDRAAADAALPPDVVSAAEEAASEIGDPELRELVARAARASLARARSGRRI